jgi:hypothetical protein
VIPVRDKKHGQYQADELSQLETVLSDYWNKSRALETETVVDLEKYLWLANGAAATVSIGFIRTAANVPTWQFWGSWLFILGIVLLVCLKFVSAITSSRDRHRFESARSKFYKDEVSDEIFLGIRDRVFKNLKRCYLILQYGSGLTFILGLVLTLVGIQCAA